ncbi:uncharacterized protein LOC129589603 [Paramacrobiotus metropolitanus]|uniref:uncharacterized protein LOC129589603 n=1 Tax=Paramacrobiotus metropolitanus TaxID=2943436 RepID=UPI002446339F|nr:uncharacterized protein LOC129589603 [Paramacrobiotus metropolitanus]
MPGSFFTDKNKPTKCAACTAKKCQRKRANRKLCDNPGKCSCVCQDTGETVAASCISAALGIGAVAAGVGLTVVTGGVAAVLIGGALVGGGASCITNPIAKAMSGERMRGDDLLKEVAVGATIGVVSGGLSTGASLAAKGASTAVKAVAQIGAATTSGAVGGAVGEVARAIDGEEVTAKSVGKSVLIGTSLGMVGGAGAQLAGVAAQNISNGVAKTAVKIGAQTATATMADAGLQMAETGEIDRKRLLTTAATAATISVTAETAKSVSMKTDAFATRRNDDLLSGKTVEGEQLTPDEKKKIGQMIKTAQNDLPPDILAKEQARLQDDRSAIRYSKEHKYGSTNAHALDRQHTGQIALEVDAKTRVICDVKEGRYVVSDVTKEHNYRGARSAGQRQYTNPKVPASNNIATMGIKSGKDDDDEDKNKKD